MPYVQLCALLAVDARRVWLSRQNAVLASISTYVCDVSTRGKFFLGKSVKKMGLLREGRSKHIMRRAIHRSLAQKRHSSYPTTHSRESYNCRLAR